jgi:uncharacterized protein (TIGR02270 family)
MSSSTSSVPTVVGQYADIAAVLWLRRDRAVHQPHYTLADLTKVDDQLEAHLDGLRIAADLGWQVAEEGLRWKEPGEVFTAGVLAWQSGEASRTKIVLACAGESAECARALVSSLGWLNGEMAAPHIDQLLGNTSAVSQRLGIAACVAHGRVLGDALEKALAARDSAVQAQALWAIGELGCQDLLPAAREAFRSCNAQVRCASAWTLARLCNEPLAIVALQESVEQQTPGQHLALPTVLRRLDPAEATRWLRRLAQDSKSVRQAIMGAGAVGTSDQVPWLLEIISNPRWSRIAAEAFVMITGIDLAKDGFESTNSGFAAGPTEDPADDNVEMDPDENLSWPDRPRLVAWWEKHRDEFVTGQRYLCGRPLDEPWLEEVLRDGYQRQRAAAALELGLLRPDQPLFNVRAPGHRQQRWLESRHAAKDT